MWYVFQTASSSLWKISTEGINLYFENCRKLSIKYLNICLVRDHFFIEHLHIWQSLLWFLSVNNICDVASLRYRSNYRIVLQKGIHKNSVKFIRNTRVGVSFLISCGLQASWHSVTLWILRNFLRTLFCRISANSCLRR